MPGSIMKRQIVQRASGFALWGFRGLFRLMSHRMAVRVGDLFGLLVFSFYRRRRELAIANLHEAFPDWSHEKLRATAERVFRNFGRTAAEFLRTPRLRPEAVQELMDTHGLEVIDKALADGKGAILITAHFGNWELMARHMTDRGYPLSVVARDANDDRTTDIVNEIRRDNGYEVFSRGNAARFILKKLSQNELVGILPDQNAGDIFVDFFGRECGSVTGPAVIHLRTGSPIIPIFCVRLPDDRHRIEVKPALEIRPTDDAREIMAMVQGAIEDQVRMYPEQWLWFHDRWKAARLREASVAP